MDQDLTGLGLAQGDQGATQPVGGRSAQGAIEFMFDPATRDKPEVEQARAFGPDAAGQEGNHLGGRAPGDGAEAAGAAVVEVQPPKAKRAAKEKAPKAPKAAKPPPGPAWDPSMRPPPLPEGTKACRILSWNVAGLRVRTRRALAAAERRWALPLAGSEGVHA